MNVNTPFIELINAAVHFKDEAALPGISFNVTRGELVCLHGSTGSGKSLALRMIAGLVRPTQGRVMVAGECINDYNANQRLWLRRTMGILVQGMQLLEDRSILENVMLPALASESSFKDARHRARLALEKCRIEHLEKMLPSKLSAGQRQITLLARSIVNHPTVILADEPAAHLDVENAQELMDLLGEFSLTGVAVIIASHLELEPHTVSCRNIILNEETASRPAGSILL